jgi:hypothetical protein
LGVGLPTLLSNAGLGSCSIIIFIFKLKHVWYAKKNHIDLNEYVGNIVKERLNTNETNK